jgi:hypothetical protein
MRSRISAMLTSSTTTRPQHCASSG